MKRIRKNSHWHLPVLVGLIWLLPGTLVAAEQTKVSIAYRTVTPNGVPVWIAQERGLFAKQGLDARILH